MNDDYIFNTLDKCLKQLYNLYEIDNVFGIFRAMDNRIIGVVIPTFEDICINNPLINTSAENDGITFYIKDIRYIYNATANGHPEYLQNLYTEEYIVNPKYDHMYHKLFRYNRDKISEGCQAGKPCEELRVALMKVMRTAMNESSAAVKFIKNCSNADKLGIIGIVEAIGDEGVFSQAKVAAAVGISRYAMTSLVAKMETAGVAEVANLGPRGTYIKIIDDTLLNIQGV